VKPGQWLLPVLAAAGVLIAVLAVVRDEKSPQPPATRSTTTSPAASPANAEPFASEVVGTGVVEAGTGNIAVGTPVPGIVSAVNVRWGERVEKGAILFQLDDRDLRAQLPAATARAQEAEVRLERSRYELKLADKLHEQHMLSDEQYRGRRFDIEADEAALATARAEVERIRIEIERRIVRSPVNGRVLQINVRPGEFADSGVLATPLMVVGDDERLRVRVDIDQNDAERVDPSAPAIAVVRGRPDLRTALQFESIEPYVAPKASLTGSPTERVDTRVLQVIYSFRRAELPVYVGQQLDVFIEAPPVGPAS
jgi:HlyD family secretion protein